MKDDSQAGEPDTERYDTERVPANEIEHLLYWGWTIIANAGEGDWTRESPAWQKAAHDWRERFHAYLDVNTRHG